MGKADKVIGYLKDYGFRNTIKKLYYRFDVKYVKGKKYYPITIPEKQRKYEMAYRPEKAVKISIIVPVYNTQRDFFVQMMESVIEQTYADWELCLADASDKEHIYIEEISNEYMKNDSRIKYKKLQSNNGISENSNSAVKMAHGDYIMLLDHDDMLHPSALYSVARTIDLEGAEFIYSDELSFDKTPDRIQSINLKPDFSWEMVRYNNFICHLTTFKRELFEEVGGFDKGVDGAQDYDIFLKILEKTDKVSHIQSVLYYWRIHAVSSASGNEAKPYIIKAGKEALSGHLKRKRIGYDSILSEFGHGPFYHIIYKVDKNRKVIVVAQDEKTKIELLNEVSGISKNKRYNISIIDTSELENIKKNENMFSEILKHDIVIIARNGFKVKNLIDDRKGTLLDELTGCLEPDENKAVSNTMVDYKGRYLNAGWCYDQAWGEKIRPLYRGVSIKDPGYMNRLHFRQTVSLLDGSMLAVKTDIFKKWLDTKIDFTDINSIFSRQSWFEICMNVKTEHANCIVTPYYPAIADKRKQRQLDKCKVNFRINDRDIYLNKNMEVFGKNYFLW